MFGFDDILALSSLVIKTGSALAGHSAQAKRNAEATANANRALQQEFGDLSLAQAQETNAANLTIQQINREAMKRDALARVSAGESGVAGASVDAILSDLSRSASEAVQTTNQNLDMKIAQLDRQKDAAILAAQNRISASPKPNPFLTGLTIAGAGLDTAATIMRRKPLNA